ncbi:MAG: T9SS type A sorting domain-containing protein [Bacteroidetes bacterium]|nr:T9SS type A sorting domain-containing protein [Bacteroidota bacterium]
MKKFILFNFVCIYFLSNAQYQVGHTTITFNDPARTGGFGSGGGAGRQIQTEIYYPATTAGDNVAVATGPFPVITFGHGFAMSWDAYTNIWQHYVNRGYILAFPRTEGGLIPGPSHGDFGTDLKQVSDKILALNTNASSIFNGKILQKAAIMGHSMGGGASFLAATNNANIETVIGLAPAETNPSAISAASNVSVSALVFSGSADGVTPPADHHIPIYQGLSSTCKSFVSITGGAHCYYANTNFNCDFGESTSSPNISITRAAQQTATYSILDPWLDFKLKGICNAYSAFMLAIGSQPGTVNETICPSVPTVSISANGMTLNSTAGGTPVGYQWYLNGTSINGATSATYQATQDGVYYLEVTYDYGCTVSNNQTLGSSGLNELLMQIKLYPNPVKDHLFIESNMQIVNVNILDINGRRITEKINGSSFESIDISNLKKGIYLVEITDGVNSITKRFIKE